MAAKRKTSTKKKTGKKFDLRCPDCDFVAAHPMGLGRHRSTRHGVIAKRQAKVSATGATGAWITRQQASDRAGVHYNTIRQWERSGALRRGSRPGARETLVSSADIDKLAATRGRREGMVAAGLASADAARLASLERAYRELATGLESLAAAVRASVMTPTATPRKSGAKRKASTKPRKSKARSSKARRR